MVMTVDLQSVSTRDKIKKWTSLSLPELLTRQEPPAENTGGEFLLVPRHVHPQPH